jgi:hypothetical protein
MMVSCSEAVVNWASGEWAQTTGKAQKTGRDKDRRRRHDKAADRARRTGERKARWAARGNVGQHNSAEYEAALDTWPPPDRRNDATPKPRCPALAGLENFEAAVAPEKAVEALAGVWFA